MRRTIKRLSVHIRTITLDIATEFHGYEDFETETGMFVHCASPHHSWERGLNEDTNGSSASVFPRALA
ncbi:MAG: hypothetical protein K2Y51_17410 [Gammaproteobacteria bacterium]|nr:hypothetical protein [Gammaproteobacteria bacterium]